MLQGRAIIVTGAARGIGREYCIGFAALGAAVVAADIRPCDEPVAAARKAGGRVLGCALDVTSMASATQLAAMAEAELGRIDGLVNNAALYGALRGGRFDAIPEDQWDAAMAVNVKGIWKCCKAVVPMMRK